MQWAQINVTAGTVAATPVQQQIYSPDSVIHRFMGSLAVDSQGNMALGFSASSSAVFPQIRYAGRLAGDTLSTLGQGEATLFAGTVVFFHAHRNACHRFPYCLRSLEMVFIDHYAHAAAATLLETAHHTAAAVDLHIAR